MKPDTETWSRDSYDKHCYDDQESDPESVPGTIDAERMRRAAEIAQRAGKETVFHRPIDVVPDWKEAFDLLAGLGITRFFTSGQSPDVSDATDILGYDVYELNLDEYWQKSMDSAL